MRKYTVFVPQNLLWEWLLWWNTIFSSLYHTQGFHLPCVTTLCAYHLDDWNSHPGSRRRPIRSAVLLDFSHIFCLLCTVRFHSVISWQPWVLLCFHHTEVYRSWVQGNLPLESTWNSSASTDLQWQSKSRCLCRGMQVGILKSMFLKYSPQMLLLLSRRRCRSEYPLWRKVL